MKVIFLDRDGVINKERPDYVKGWSEFEFLPGSLEAMKLLTLNGYCIIVITNQSAVNRKMITDAELQEIHDKMTADLAARGGNIEAIYYCPHLPEDDCSCRKPEPGLIYRAQTDYGLNLSETCVVGDSLKDMRIGRLTGCGRIILVRTGHGEETERICQDAGITPDYVADDLMAAVKWLLDEGSKLKAQS